MAMTEEILIIGNNLNKIENLANVLHWNSRGDNYYSDHLLYQKIYEDIADQVDGLIETCLIPIQKATDIEFNYSDLFNYTISFPITPQMLLDLIVDTIRKCDALSRTDIPEGIKTYLTDVSKSLLVKGGLLDRRLK